MFHAAIATLVDAGHVLLSRSVLLKGINADLSNATGALMGALGRTHQPYYLHHPDLAPGTSHFRLTLEEGERLVKPARQPFRAGAGGALYPRHSGGAEDSGIGALPLRLQTPGVEEAVAGFVGGQHIYPPAQGPGDIDMQDKMPLAIVSDIACPWCFIGKARLETALERYGLEG